MDIEKNLKKENSRKNWDKIAAYIKDSHELFADLFQVFLHGDKKSVIGASQIIGVLVEKEPQLIQPYFQELITYLQSDPIDAVKRNTMRIFQFIDIPEEIEGELFDIALQYTKSRATAVAIKAFSMTVLRKICEKYPELSHEVILQIEILAKENVSAGLKSRGNYELLKLQKIIKNFTPS